MSLEVARRVVDSFHRPTDRRRPPLVAALTKREEQVLELLARGDAAKEIAKATGLTLGTVRVHLHAIYQKLGVENRVQAVNFFHGR